ncbi:MAG: hypothetical protein WCQ16_07800 [Verrucomicrobiae bacterium]
MKTDPLKQGALTDNSTGIDSVTGGLVMNRAIELALINGRSAIELSKTDWEQAKREMTEESD